MKELNRSQLLKAWFVLDFSFITCFPPYVWFQPIAPCRLGHFILLLPITHLLFLSIEYFYRPVEGEDI